MLNRRDISLLTVGVSLLISAVMCDVLDTRESDALLEAQNMTSIAAEATRFSGNLTETAEASITPSPQPSSTSTAPATSTPEPVVTSAPDGPNYTFDSLNLPDAVFSMTDPSGDSYVCANGEPVDDPAVDIMSVNIYDPQLLGATHQNWFVRVELGVPTNETFANDWSGSVLVAFAASGAAAYTITINEIHAGEVTKGTLDESGQSILPGTGDSTFIDDQGNIWFLIPEDTTFLQFASFHLPTEDLSPEQKRCDLAPNEDVYTVHLP
jgi:hypothetical protein